MRDYVDRWNSRIATWIEEMDAGRDPSSCDAGAEPVLRCYRGNGRHELDRRALPEPYVGNPASPNLQAVVLALNPGGTIPAWQAWPAGNLVAVTRLRGYAELANDWSLAPKTRRWWGKPAAWAARILDESPSIHSIVGMDMIPFHSTGFGTFAPDAAADAWLRENVFGPAAELARRTAISQGTRLPVVLGLTAMLRGALRGAGATELETIDPLRGAELYPSWPRRPDGRPNPYTVSAELLPGGGGVAIVASLRAALQAPPPALDLVVRDLIDRHAR